MKEAHFLNLVQVLSLRELIEIILHYLDFLNMHEDNMHKEWFQWVPTNLNQIKKVGFLLVNEELFQWIPTIWTQPNLKVDLFHVSEE